MTVASTPAGETPALSVLWNDSPGLQSRLSHVRLHIPTVSPRPSHILSFNTIISVSVTPLSPPHILVKRVQGD